MSYEIRVKTHPFPWISFDTRQQLLGQSPGKIGSPFCGPFHKNQMENLFEDDSLRRIQGVSRVGSSGGHHSSSPGDKLQISRHLIRQLNVYKRIKSARIITKQQFTTNPRLAQKDAIYMEDFSETSSSLPA